MNHFIWELILYSLNFIHSYTRWDPKKPRLFIYKKLCNYSCMFKLQSPSKSSPLDAKHLSRCFSTAPNSFWTCQFGCYLSASAVFCFTSFTLAEDFFHPGKQTKKSFRVRSGEWEGWGLEDMLFLVKNCWTLSMVWAGALVNHPSWNGQMWWKSLQKKLTEDRQPLTTTPAGPQLQMGS